MTLPDRPRRAGRTRGIKRLHDERWPWCDKGATTHTHTERASDVPLVDGQPTGPMTQLTSAAMIIADAQAGLLAPRSPGWDEPGGPWHPMVVSISQADQQWQDEMRLRSYRLAIERGHLRVN
jgi:hypothetical protein